MKYLEELEEGSNDGIDVAVKLTTEAPKNVQDPIFSRWGTVLAAIELFVDTWITTYFVVIAIKGDQRSGYYLQQIACALISLMNNKSKPTMDGDSIKDFTGSFSSNHKGDSVKKLKPGETPICLTVFYFLDGFNKFFYQDMFNFLMKNDPFFGDVLLASQLALEPKDVM